MSVASCHSLCLFSPLQKEDTTLSLSTHCCKASSVVSVSVNHSWYLQVQGTQYPLVSSLLLHRRKVHCTSSYSLRCTDFSRFLHPTESRSVIQASIFLEQCVFLSLNKVGVFISFLVLILCSTVIWKIAEDDQFPEKVRTQSSMKLSTEPGTNCFSVQF